MLKHSVYQLLSIVTAVLLLTTIVAAHSVSIENAVVSARVLGEIKVSDMLGDQRVRVVKPCDCRRTGISLDQTMVLSFPATGNDPIGIVRFVDVDWSIASTNANAWSAVITVVDVENGGSENVETGTEANQHSGTVHIGLGPGRYAVFLSNVSAVVRGDFGPNHPYGDHEAHLERGTIAFVTVGKPPCGGQVTMLIGEATVTPGSGSTASASFGGVIHPGDIITLGDKSFAEITLPDQSVIRIAPNSSLQFDQVLCEPMERSFSGRLFFGAIWSKVTTVLGGEGKFKVTGDKDATCGVRGTIFTVDADSVRTVFRVYPEPGKKSELIVYGKPGDTVIVRQGQESFVERGRHASPPRLFRPEMVDRWWEPFDKMRAIMSIEWNPAAPDKDAPR